MRRIIVVTFLAMIMSIALISLTRGIEGRASASNTNSPLLVQGRATVSINDATLTEGDAGTSNMVFTVTVTGSHSNTVGVDYATANGSATAPSDYISTSGQLVIPPGGDAARLITVPIVGDASPEPVETFFVNLSIVDSSADLADGQGVGTIQDMDVAPTLPVLSIGDVSLNEGNTGTVDATFTVSLSAASSSEVTVSYATADGLATVADNDYASRSGTISFPPGDSSPRSIIVPIVGDPRNEPDETFLLNLSNPVGGTIADGQGVCTIVNDDPACSFSIHPASRLFTANGGTGSVSVTAPIGCTWIAGSNAAWITVTSGATGSGNGTASYSVATNPGAGRTGTMTIAGQTFTVDQQEAGSCASISPTTQSFGANGGIGSFAVTAPLVCNWTAVSNDLWITITSGANGSGNGMVNYSVAPNTGQHRTGTITVAGRIFTVTQEGARGCFFSLNGVTQNFPREGGTGVVSVTAPAGCNWTATSNSPWISIGNTTSGSGDGGVDYTVAPNSGAPRTGTITVAGLTFVVSQEGIEVCNYDIDPTLTELSGGGGTGSIAVRTGGGCEWSATHTENWITITSATIGAGNGFVSFSVEPNPSGAYRLATIIIAARVVTVIQDPCSFSLPSEKVQDFSAARGTSSVRVYSYEGCNWTATSNDPWITITSGASASGDGAVVYEVAENTGPARTGTMTIAREIFVVNQLAPGPCPYELLPPNESIAASNQTIFIVSPSVQVRAPLGCAWTAVSQAPWITIPPGGGNGQGNGDGTVYYTVADNTGSARSGRMTIAGRSFTVTQAAPGQCNARLATTTQNFGRNGGNGNVQVLTPLGCDWTASSNDPWIVLGNKFNHRSINYSVARNQGGERIGSLTIAGNNYVVIQERCPVSFSPDRAAFSYLGGLGEFSVDVGCTPGAVSNNPSWITIIRDDNLVKYSVAQNSGGFRTGGISVGDRTFTVSQFAAGSCDLSIAPTHRSFTATTKPHVFGENKFTVTAPPHCEWTSSTDSSWISFGSERSGRGNGEVTYSIAVNPSPNTRTGTITIRLINTTGSFPPQLYTVSQDGTLPPCVETISPPQQAFDGNPHPQTSPGVGPTFTVHVTAHPDCEWEAVTEAPWVTLQDNNRHTGSGEFHYRLSKNTTGERNAVINFGGQIHTITQGVGECPVEVICQLFPAQCDEPPQARSFRDNVLAQTSRGKRYTELYYKFSTEIVGIMMLNPMLILRSREFLERYMPVVQSMVRGEQVTLTEGDIEEIDGFLRSFAGKGSLELQETVNGVCQDLRETQVQLEFNITVTTGQKRALPLQSGGRFISRTGLIAAPLGILLFICFYRVKPMRSRVSKTTLKRLLCLAILFSVGVGQPSAAAGQARRTRSSLTFAKAAKNTAALASKTYGELPLRFEANRDQLDSQVKFFSRGSGYNLYLTPTEAVMTLRNQGAEAGSQKGKQPALSTGLWPPASDTTLKSTHVMRMKFIGANTNTLIRGIDELPGRSNYFLGDRSKWRSDVSTYARVEYENIYSGIGLVYYGNQGELEYDFNLAPGADPAAIKFDFQGPDAVEIDSAGELVMSFASGEVRQRRPMAYQNAGGIRQPVACRYRIRDHAIGFEVGDYDRRRPLIIDPVLTYSTYFGGSGNEEGNSIAVDSAGNVYVTGFTDSINFPLTNGSQPVIGGGQQDAFVMKLDPSGTRLLYSTYIGGTGQDNGTSIAVDSAGNAYVTGFTDSANFPVRNALQPTKKGSFNAFVIKLDAAGSMLNSTFFGGTISDYGSSIAVDSAGNIYVAGLATSTDVPTTNALQPAHGGLVDTFVAKIDSSGTRLVYSTYLGGSGIDGASSIAVDSAGNIYLTGLTSSRDFRTVNPLQATHGEGVFDAFVTKLNPSSGQIIYSTYLGGRGEDRAFRMAVDPAGSAYVIGDTDSTNFPVASALQTTNNGSSDAFVTKLSPNGSALIYSTYLGGSGIEGGTAITVDSSGSAYVTGFTGSSDFPTIAPLQHFGGGGFDGFVAKLNSSGAVEYSTYLGGTGIDSAFGVAADPAGNAYIMGVTSSKDFPTANPLQQTFGGGTADLFVARIKPDLRISSAIVAGKKLLVLGTGFDQGATILLNGQPQKTINDGQNPTTSLVSNQAGKKIAPSERVTLRVRNSDGAQSNEFSFTRPVQ